MPAQTAPTVLTVPITTAAPNRVLSVDVLRGVTIAFMILVNDPGDGRHTYTQLEHARWNGFTLTDLVFPTFLFLVGASIIFSLSARSASGSSINASGSSINTSGSSINASGHAINAGGPLNNASRGKLALRIIRRAAIIFLLDLLLTAMPYFHLTTLRIFGVLTRIAICYLIVGLLCLFTRRVGTLLAISAVLLVGYWALMRFVPVPGFGVPTHDIPLLNPDRNLAAWLDRGINDLLQRTLHTGRLYEHTRDPEGLLSTLPAIVTTIFGSITALWLRRTHANPSVDPLASSTGRSQSQHQTLRGLLLAALACLISGRLWNSTFPINKNLWTSSYVLFAAGCSLLGLALCYWLVDILRLQHRSHLGRAALWPWLVFGSNAITAYAMSNVFVKLLFAIKIHDPSMPDPANRNPTHMTNASGWIYNHLFARGDSTNNTSLAFALAFVALCFLPNLFLWRKRLFLKV